MQPFFRLVKLLGPRPSGETPEAPPRAAGRRSSKTALWRYLVSERYADTVIHGLFHFVVIMLAFVVANVWASREAKIREIRGEYAVLILLENELSGLRAYADRLSKETVQPCKDGFSNEAWSPRKWDSMRPEDLSYLLLNWDFYNQLVVTYDDVRSRMTQSESVTSVKRCKELWANAWTTLNNFSEKMITHRAELQRQYESYQGLRGLLSMTNVRIYGWTVAALIVVIILPVALRIFEISLRRLLSTVATAEDRTEHVEPSAESIQSSVPGKAPPVNPTGGSPPQAATGDGATTTGSY